IMTPGQLLTRLPGTNLYTGDGSDDPYFRRSQRVDLGSGKGGGICYPVVVVDGMIVRNDPYYKNGSPDTTNYFRNLAPRANDISAIEVYRSSAQAPAEWQSSANNCGMIMIWTKH
ncbi:MAG: hypothetical protein RQ745_08375, partial [Longimicrobiales bacterium]|nr:hypothetical protein [Longimicrobiales bacterium]